MSAGERGEELALVRDLVAARLSARRAIVKPVAAQTNVDLALAGAAILFTIALFFSHFALHTVVLVLGRGGHKRTLARVRATWKVPLVTALLLCGNGSLTRSGGAKRGSAFEPKRPLRPPDRVEDPVPHIPDRSG